MKNHNMLSIATCLLVGTIFSTSCEPPLPCTLTEADQQIIRDMTSNVQDSWNKGDRQPYVDRFSDDASYMPPYMETIVGRDAIRNFASGFPEVNIKYSLVEIMGSAEYAYVRGAYALTNKADSLLDSGKFLSIWKKTSDNQWLLTHDMFSSDLPLSTPKEKN